MPPKRRDDRLGGMADTPGSIAFDESAPASERLAAQTELQKSTMPAVMSELIPRDDLRPVIDFIAHRFEEEQMSKALSKNNIIPFPSNAAEKRKPGMQSVFLDDMQLTVTGDYYERPSVFTFDSMRSMVEQTPILNAVIMTRIRQISRFCKLSDPDSPGFQVRLRDKDATASKAELKEIAALQGFFINCGWEDNPRKRLKLHRDHFSGFMAKLVRDSLTMDSMPIETEFKRNRDLGMDGLYAVDGATIRLCTEQGYQGDDEIFALQLIQGRIRAAYSHDDLIYIPRNPRTDVLSAGYGLSETELLIRVVTGFLNAFSYNTKYFDSNAIPKGILHLSGNYTEEDINGFKRYWNAMVKGVSNWWTLPVMVSKDQESKASFENLGADVDEMLFARWMTFLTSIICAIYGMSPDEINFESFNTGKSSLSGDDTEEKIANSKDSGLEPVLSYYENIFTDYVISDFAAKYEFAWTGRTKEDPKQSFEEVKLCNTVNELRASRGEEAAEGAWGDAPLNPVLIPVWQQENMPDTDENGDQEGLLEDAFPKPAAGAKAKEKTTPDKKRADGSTKPGKPPKKKKKPADAKEVATMSKAFGLPIYYIET